MARGRVRAAPRAGSPTETPLFAICLGAQTLAHAFGGRVAKLRRQQAGLRGGVAHRRGRARPGARRAARAASRRSSGTATASSVPDDGGRAGGLGRPAAGLPRRRARLGRAVPPGGAQEQRDASGSPKTTGSALSRGRSASSNASSRRRSTAGTGSAARSAWRSSPRRRLSRGGLRRVGRRAGGESAATSRTAGRSRARTAAAAGRTSRATSGRRVFARISAECLQPPVKPIRSALGLSFEIELNEPRRLPLLVDHDLVLLAPPELERHVREGDRAGIRERAAQLVGLPGPRAESRRAQRGRAPGATARPGRSTASGSSSST